MGMVGVGGRCDGDGWRREVVEGQVGMCCLSRKTLCYLVMF